MSEEYPVVGGEAEGERVTKHNDVAVGEGGRPAPAVSVRCQPINALVASPRIDVAPILPTEDRLELDQLLPSRRSTFEYRKQYAESTGKI